MEVALKLRKPSYKKLLVLLNTAEQILFTYPVPSELVSKYVLMRTEIFKSLRITNSGLQSPENLILSSKKDHFIKRDKEIDIQNAEYKNEIQKLNRIIDEMNKDIETAKSKINILEMELSKKGQLELIESLKNSEEMNLKTIEILDAKNKNTILEATVKELLLKLSENENLLVNRLEESEHLRKESLLLNEKLEASKKNMDLLRCELSNRNSEYQNELNLIKQRSFDQELILKNSHEDNLIALNKLNSESVSKLKEKFESELFHEKEENCLLKYHMQKIEETHSGIVESLQLELHKTKQSLHKLHSTLNEKQAKDTVELKNTIEKLEQNLIFHENLISDIAGLVMPVYELYAHEHRDWNQERELKSNIYNETINSDIMIACEFTVFFLEKTIKDKQWLVNKLEEIYLDHKLINKNLLGASASPSSLIENEFYNQVWHDIKSTTETLKNFEKSRQNLLLHFSN